MNRILPLALFLSPLVAGTAACAQEALLPGECTPYLTVQRRDCVVEHHYTCPSVPGHRWRIDFDDEPGALFVSEIDAEAGWVSSQEFPPEGAVTRLLPGSPDAPSISTLLDTGEDHYTFSEIRDGRIVRIEGHDRLTGERVEIDGEPLLRTEYAYRMYSAEGLLEDDVAGHEFVSARHRRFFSGLRTWHAPEGDFTRDSTPVEFAYPGEPGFLAQDPIHGCGAMISALPRMEGHA